MSGSIFCNNCQSENSPEAKFCWQCGELLNAAPQPATCKSCGAPLVPNAAFCTACGATCKADLSQPASNPQNAPEEPRESGGFKIPKMPWKKANAGEQVEKDGKFWIKKDNGELSREENGTAYVDADSFFEKEREEKQKIAQDGMNPEMQTPQGSQKEAPNYPVQPPMQEAYNSAATRGVNSHTHINVEPNMGAKESGQPSPQQQMPWGNQPQTPPQQEMPQAQWGNQPQPQAQWGGQTPSTGTQPRPWGDQSQDGPMQTVPPYMQYPPQENNVQMPTQPWDQQNPGWGGQQPMQQQSMVPNPRQPAYQNYPGNNGYPAYGMGFPANEVAPRQDPLSYLAQNNKNQKRSSESQAKNAESESEKTQKKKNKRQRFNEVNQDGYYNDRLTFDNDEVDFNERRTRWLPLILGIICIAAFAVVMIKLQALL